MGQRWAISDPRWDSRLSLRLLRLCVLGVWSAGVFAWCVGAVYAGTINKGAITRTGTPYTFWIVVSLVFTASIATLVYNLYLFLRRRHRTPKAV